ncbi:MAG TPA: PD-(D/E)XK nuclease family protein [Steroidobacteraceae bacterium]|nr:PD-(D/E)XK nuclease family protein [Steroidobacteraceae bacterium]
MNSQRLSAAVSQALAAGATLIVPSAQRQAAIRSAWAESQRDAGRTLWPTPRVFTFTQFAERTLAAQWSAGNLPDRLLPPGAEWATLREHCRDSGGSAEARALLNSIRTLGDWRIGASARVLGASPEGERLVEALRALERLGVDEARRPLRAWLDELESPAGGLFVAGGASLAAAPLQALRRLGATFDEPAAASRAVSIATADNDEHELELIADWCRAELERDPARRLLIVDGKLRQRRRLYERLLSQTLSPSEWLSLDARATPTTFSIEGGRPLAEFPLVSHALLTLRLLTSRLRFDEVVHWVRLPFLDGTDVAAGAAIEALLRDGRKLEYGGAELAGFLEHADSPVAAALAARLRTSLATLAGERRAPAEWAPALLAALRQLGWPGTRPLRSDEQQTLARWHVLLDEYAALGAWLPSAGAADAAATLIDLAAERNFDPQSAAAPVTLTESLDDPIVRYDAIWVAGLDAAAWPAPPRPDVFIPSAAQIAAGVPWASAAGQARVARASLAAWRASTDSLTCSWARLEGDAHRSPSPLLVRLADASPMPDGRRLISLAEALRKPLLVEFDDSAGLAVPKGLPVRGGVKPLTLQAECGFHAYGEVRLNAAELERPEPGLDPRERGMLMHKALELVWIKLQGQFSLIGTDEQVRLPLIADSVAAAVVSVFRGRVPKELERAIERESHRLERLIEVLFRQELRRPSFDIEVLEARRVVSIAGGQFELRIDRIDSIEGGGYAIIDYKSGQARTPRWNGEDVRDPQLLAYLLAERGRNVQALANVSLTQGRARFAGKSARPNLLPDVGGLPGMNPNKVPADEIEAAWQAELGRWIHGLQMIASDYLAGRAPVEPASDVCRNCHLTVLCRRVELAANDVRAGEDHE